MITVRESKGMRRGQYCSDLMALILASDGSTPVAHIMSQWLDMNAIAKLDSAIVGGRLREDFLASLKHWKIFNGLGAGTDSVAFVDWLLLRGITVRVLHPVLQKQVNQLWKEESDDGVARAALYKRIVTVHPCYRHAPTLCDYGDLLIGSGEIAEAEAMYQRALAIDPDDVITLGNYGILLHKRGDLAEAEAMYQRVYDIDPEIKNNELLINKLGKKASILLKFYAWSGFWTIFSLNFFSLKDLLEFHLLD